ncbi:MAG TPA: hypothetical protein VNY05_12365 [Candidatus Acidoferrales bacterium]|jgi:uncharacterized protein (TIGR03437 family)|nr:hypothetical protein [Candidatus Acidoferrales bacterium]
MRKAFILTFLAAITASAAAKVTSVFNAASNIPLGNAGSGIAQGAFFVVFGSGLGPALISIASMPYPTSIGGTTVTVTPAGGTPVTAYLYYSEDGQVSGILPSATPTGPANVTVTYNSSTSDPVKITVVKSYFGIFTLNQAGTGPAAVLNRNPDGLNSLTNSVASGGTLEVYGTGLGPITVADNAPPGAVSPAGIDVKVLVAGQTIATSYAGRAPQFAGLDQIDFQLPSDASVPDGCFIPFAIQVNGVVSNYGTFAKAAGGKTCTAPLGLSAATLQKLDAGGTATVGLLSLGRNTTALSVVGKPVLIDIESASGAFAPFNAAGLFGLNLTPGALPPLNAVGTCIVQTQGSTSPPINALPPLAKDMDAGSKLTLSGPGGVSKDLTRSIAVGSAGYSAVLSSATPVIQPGQWTMTGTGGADIGAFTSTVTVPAPLACTNCDGTTGINTIDRTKPLLVTWTGGGGSGDYVQVGGLSTVVSTADAAKNVAVIFSCSARASDLQFTVPASILNQMPQSSADLLAANTGALVLVNVLGNSGTAFTAPLTAGGNIDLGFFGYSATVIKLVGYN